LMKDRVFWSPSSVVIYFDKWVYVEHNPYFRK
jgi:hypothetical protein